MEENDNPVIELANSIDEIALRMQDPGFFKRDYRDVTADIDTLDSKINKIIEILRYCARAYAEDEEEEDDSTTDGISPVDSE